MYYLSKVQVQTKDFSFDFNKSNGVEKIIDVKTEFTRTN